MATSAFVLVILCFSSLAAASDYTVKIYTSDERFAGTDSNVLFRLFDENGQSQLVKLKYKRSDFERGSVYIIDVLWSTLSGPITKINIGHDNSAIFGGAWKLFKVEVEGTNGGKKFVNEFFINKWLENSSGKATYVSVENQLNRKDCGKMVASARVVNGNTAIKGQWPWQVQLKAMGQHHCGGTLVHPEYVVTASHCVAMSYPDPKSFEIILGNHDQNMPEPSEQAFKAKEIHVHPSYNPRTFDNDIAIIKLDKPAILNDYVKTACLPPQDFSLRAGKTCYITGWGRIYGGGPTSVKLEQAILPSVSNFDCDAVMNNVNPNGGITDNMLCAGGNDKSGCHGDSGGPYVCENNGKYYLQGAVSWGNPYCRTKGFFTVFARLGSYVNWISSHVENVRYVNGV